MTAVLPGGLFAVALGLTGLVAWQALAPVSPLAEPPAHAVASRPSPAVVASYAPPPEEQFAVINARPLFDPARQPVLEPAPSGPRSALPPDLSLVGVAIGGAHSVALLKRPDGRAAISAQLGQSIDGWQLVRVAPDFVILRAGATDYTVKLRGAAGLPQPVLNHASPPATTDQTGQ